MSDGTSVDMDALLCALVLAPNTYARNRFFGMYEQPALKRVRKRAKRVRGIIRQLTGSGRELAEIVGEQVFDDRVLLRFQVARISYQQTTSLSLLESALVHYALHKALGTELKPEDRKKVEATMLRLGQNLDFGVQTPETDPPSQTGKSNEE